ncbi:MAG: hypothetical protein EOP18_00920 [Rhizobiaceae bacterium]|nr:MAG: hypothetical protein EOP18_00920 [Rhizobiaceae bacterium]
MSDQFTLADRIVLRLVGLAILLRHPYLLFRISSINGRLLDVVTPRTDLDRFAWRKLFDHNPLFTMCCDKLASKQHALEVAPGLKTAETLWVGDSVEAIPFDKLAGNVVFKANHGSGWNVMIRDGHYERENVLRKARRWLSNQYGWINGEWGYKHARKRLVIERMLLEDGEPVNTEYKFHISGGRTAYVYMQRKVNEEKSWLCVERDGTALPEPAMPGSGWAPLPIPPEFEHMREAAEKLGAPFDHIRVDLYAIDGDIYFSELTVYPQSGRSVVNPRLVWLRTAGWHLENSWFLSTPQRGWRCLYARAVRRWLATRLVQAEVRRAEAAR